jgi:hypothetical protein
MKKQPKPHKPATFTRSNPSEEKPPKMFLDERENRDELTTLQELFVIGMMLVAFGSMIAFILSYR